MTRVDPKIETCSCQTCRSDLAYIAPCEKVSRKVQPAMMEIPPIPFVM